MYTTQKILEMYFDQDISIKAIADECGTYPNNIRRKIIKTGRSLRSKSEAQKAALKSGRHTHPTEGKKRSQSTKDKIGKSATECWENLTEDELKYRQKIGKDSWNSKSVEEKADFKRKARKELMRSSKEGSKLEKFLRDKLTEAGYNITFHQSHLLENERLHIDIMVDNLGVALEIDGPSHNSPIWGSDALIRSKKADAQKNGLLINAGLKVIRVKYRKSLSQQYKKSIWEGIEMCLKNSVHLKPLTYLGEDDYGNSE